MKFLFLAAAVLVSGTSYAQSTTYTVDSAHTSIVFKVNHMGFSHVYGLLPGTEGTVNYDEKKPEATSFDLKIPVANITTGTGKRDDHLKGNDFFNSKQFPHILVKSKSVKKSGAGLDVAADLTLLGKTKPVNFTFKVMQAGKDPMSKKGGDRAGGEAQFKIKRSDFGMMYGLQKAGDPGDEIEIIVSLEATK